jgi:hypothetical protein
MAAKLLDFGRREQQEGTVGRPRELALRCDAYRVTLPAGLSGSSHLNPFERVVLSLLALGRYDDVEKLATDTCLPADLVTFILLRLQDIGLASTDHGLNELTDRGKEELGLDSARRQTEVSYSTYMVFRERITDTLLPMMVDTEELPLVEVYESDGLHAIRGKGHTRLWELGGRWQGPPAPTSQEIAAALRKMRRRAVTIGRRLPDMSVEGRITVAPLPETYFLWCKQVIQEFDSDWRITDPFGYGFSREVESAYETLIRSDEGEYEALQTWQKRVVRRRSEEVRTDAAPPNTYGAASNPERYPQLVAALRRNDLYGSLEWALHYLNTTWDLSTARQLVQVEKHDCVFDEVSQAAQTLGIELDERRARPFFDLRPGKVQAQQQGSAELATELPLAILSATGNPGHPLGGLAADVPGFFDRILDIKGRRDEVEHGQARAVRDEEQINVWESEDGRWVAGLIARFLPDVRVADPTAGSDATATSHFDDRLSARIQLQHDFGQTAFLSWPNEVQDALVGVEQAWLTLSAGEVPDATRFVNALYRTGERVLRLVLGSLPAATPDGDLLDGARVKAENAGFGPLPQALATVKAAMLGKSLTTNTGSLGSAVLAYLLQGTDDDFARLRRGKRSFLPVMARIVELRGHGNHVVRIRRLECDSLRRDIYNIVQGLLE